MFLLPCFLCYDIQLLWVTFLTSNGIEASSQAILDEMGQGCEDFNCTSEICAADEYFTQPFSSCKVDTCNNGQLDDNEANTGECLHPEKGKKVLRRHCLASLYLVVHCVLNCVLQIVGLLARKNAVLDNFAGLDTIVKLGHVDGLSQTSNSAFQLRARMASGMEMR